MSAGTILLTGANSTLGLAYVRSALEGFPDHHAILTVRNNSDSDPNTAKLMAIIAGFPNAKHSIHTLDLASLDSVRSLSSEIAEKVTAGKLSPLSTIVCNAFAWSISGGLKMTGDGYELSFQVNHLAHFLLVLRLLGSMDKANGRIVVLSSDTHYPGKSTLEQFPPAFPVDIDKLAKPSGDVVGEEVGRGFQRYGLSKLCTVMFTHEINRRLQGDPNLKEIMAVAMDPGGLTDSQAMNDGVPKSWGVMMKYFLNPLQPVLKYGIPTLRKTSEAGKDLLELSMGRLHAGERGHFVMSKPEKSSPESYEEEKWKVLWQKSVEWSGIQPSDTVLPLE